MSTDTQASATPRQLAMVIDLNKCIGCQTCTVACKRLWTDEPGMAHMWWNIVNTIPGQGTPRGWEGMGGGFRDGQPVLGALPTEEELGRAWEFNFEEVFRGGKAATTHLHPVGEPPQWGPNWDEDQGGGEYPNGYYFYLPRLCNHCSDPPCLRVCPVQAISKRDDGTVLIDETRCQHNRLCQRACPYKRIYSNAERPFSQKCVLCFPRIERGVAPACVRQCPGRARHFGWLDDAAGHVHALVQRWKVALPLHPEWGTSPNVYYVPPLLPAPLRADGTVDPTGERVPRDLLRGLFGAAVDEALTVLRRERERSQQGGASELIDLLIGRRWRDLLGPFDAAPSAV